MRIASLITPTSTRKVFSALDGLRGVAAIAILSRHLPDPGFAQLIPGSYLAVDLFFAISGFVLAHSYLSRLQNGMSAADFMVSRLIRLYPLYFLSTLLSFSYFLSSTDVFKGRDIAFGLDGPRLTGCIISSFLFLPTPTAWSGESSSYPFDFPAWSLFFELVINLGWAASARRMTTSGIYCILGFGLGLLAFTSLYWHGLDAGWRIASFWGGAGRVVYSFFAGIAAYIFWRKNTFPRVKISAPAAIVFMLLIFALEPAHMRSAYDFVAASLIFPMLVLAAARCETSRIQRLVCRYLGTTSYAIYVIQAPFILWLAQLSRLTTGHSIESFGILSDVFCMIIIILAAYLLDLKYDPHARTVLQRLAR